jgi:hypothetical protein
MNLKSVFVGLLLFFFFNHSVTAQKISFNKLLSFFSNDENIVENYLQTSGYEYNKKQQWTFTSTISVYWDFISDTSTYHVIVGIDTTSQKTVSIDYEFYSHQQYGELVKAITAAGFAHVGRMLYGDKETTQEYRRNDVHLIVSTTTYDKNESLYSITICYCSLKNN